MSLNAKNQTNTNVNAEQDEEGLWQGPQFKAGDRVFWADPDHGACSQTGTITHTQGEDGEPLFDDCIISIKTDSGGEVEALPKELTLLGDREHTYGLNGRAIAPYDFKALAEFVFYYGVQAKSDKQDAIEELWHDTRIGADHLKGYVLAQVLRNDPVVQALHVPGPGPVSDEAVLFALVAAYGSQNLKHNVAKDIAKTWAGDRHSWHNDTMYSPVHLAFKVKAQKVDLLPEQDAKVKELGLNMEAIFESCQRWVWDSWTEELRDLAQDLTKNYGDNKGLALAAGVISEGRSAGWVVPCIAGPHAKDFNEDHALRAEEVKTYLKDVEMSGQDADYDPNCDMVDMANRILVLRQFQCQVDWVMSNIDMIWQDYVDEHIAEIEDTKKGPGLRQAGKE